MTVSPEDWGWTGELPPADVRGIGPISFELWRRGGQWVNRRVETIELLDADTVRVAISIDFRIPTKLPGEVCLGGKKTFFLPLTVLPRRVSLAYFDVRDESGASVPMLTRQENARLTSIIMLTAARRALQREKSGLDLSDAFMAYLASIPMWGAGRARAFVEPLLDPTNALIYPDPAVARVVLADRNFRDLLGLCNSCSFIHVPLAAEAGERRIIKFSFLSPWGAPPSTKRKAEGSARHRLSTWLGWQPETRHLVMPQVGNAVSFHAQLSAPERVEFTEAGMHNDPPADLVKGIAKKAPKLEDPLEEDENDARGYQQFVGGIRRRKHLYVEGAEEHRSGLIWVRLRVVRSGFLRAAVAVAWMTTALLALFALRSENVLGEAQTAAALLLLVPALIAGFLIAPGEHGMTRRLLRGPRTLTAVIGGLALLATAALLTLPGSGEDPSVPGLLLWTWRGEAVIALIVSILLTVGLFLPRGGDRETSSPPAEPAEPFTDDEPDEEAGGSDGNV